ncbi:PREDICTED: uncharacterized protein LOC104731232 [Camelina sativa]|uniref:Uncharacterized protein LOC104731232 n=1 Tax=Camelina sativa TaxID=90675 RepID=A0ABM0V069_CAMSA|nr:PREDICTED: uncharacterized protein LOC104731232 [Camelina sativa]XP_010448854.1 PREDICTED: uncharacterized protein LOC104731232 [Camelina sativa]
MQELRNMMQEILDRPVYAPPPPPREAAPRQPPPVAPRHRQPPPLPAEFSYFETMKLMGTMGTEYFIGGNDQTRADDWQQTLEKNFRTARCPMEFRKDLAVHYLRGNADNWWRNVERSLPVGYVPTWEDFLDEFNKKYFPQEAMDQLECEFLELRQGIMTVREYDAEFTRLRRFIGREYGEQELIRRFMRGLRANIRNRCSIRGCISMVELVEQAATIERGIEEEAEDLIRTNEGVTKEEKSHKRIWDNNDSELGQNRFLKCVTCGRKHGGTCWEAIGACIRCGGTDHLVKNCPIGNGDCRRCGQLGHYARECTMLQRGGHQGNQNRENLPPPPKRQALRPGVFATSNQGVASDIALEQDQVKN